MNKSQVIALLVSEKWTKADAIRALEGIDFATNPDELTIRRAISPFSGAELINRQRLQAAQKAQVTKKTNEIERLEKAHELEIEKLKARIQNPSPKDEFLEAKVKALASQNDELIKVNDGLKKDNKALKNLVDRIRLKTAIDVKNLLKYEDSEIRRALAKWFKGTQG
ncbi:hypothetical protein [Phormidesmis priestleyi]|uniref:hypothetical protein n=1 Tax=Phormidesmis priestleyi TaxID=268141 RepID=UPI00083B87F5|nr:hypothetical protein [Phormidesmis priestleyi]